MTVQEFHTEIDNVTEAFRKSFGHLTEDQLNWNNQGNCWSIAQNIDHIVKINRSYEPILTQLNDNKLVLPFMSKIGFFVKLFGNMILKSVNPDRSKKIKTFPIWEPNGQKHPEHILTDFVKEQEWLKQLISDNVNRFNDTIYSPANKNIVYKLGKAFEIMVVHERRHYNQALEVLEMKVG